MSGYNVTRITSLTDPLKKKKKKKKKKHHVFLAPTSKITLTMPVHRKIRISQSWQSRRRPLNSLSSTHKRRHEPSNITSKSAKSVNQTQLLLPTVSEIELRTKVNCWEFLSTSIAVPRFERQMSEDSFMWLKYGSCY